MSWSAPIALVHSSIAFVAVSICSTANAQPSTLAEPDSRALFGWPVHTGLFIGPENNPEVNINGLSVGPRGWIFGCTEEHGWLFILDPKTKKMVQWNAGRREPARGYSFEGDITDFVVWEEKGRIVIVACQALPPSEIFRYELPIPDTGLPDVSKLKTQRVYRNARWGRVMSIGRGRSRAGTEMLLAGSLGHAELIRSNDDGRSWKPVDYWNAIPGLDGKRHLGQISGANATIVEIHYAQLPVTNGRRNATKGVWLLFLSYPFVFSGERVGAGHGLNGILVSADGGDSWQVARVARRNVLPQNVRNKINGELQKKRLHPNFYELVGETAQTLAVLPDGSMVIGTAYDNVAKHVYGGRVLRSLDGGLTWENGFQFPGKRDVRLAHVGDGVLLAGTTTHWFPIPQNVKQATGDLYISHDKGKSFRFLAQVVKETKPADYRRPTHTNYFYAGIGAITSTKQTVVVGTVNESRRAEIILLPRSR